MRRQKRSMNARLSSGLAHRNGVWNERNNPGNTNVVTSILVIGLVGMALDQLLARAQRAVTFPE